jgi:hypothetical protein
VLWRIRGCGLSRTNMMTWAGISAYPISFSGSFIISHAPLMQRRIICCSHQQLLRDYPTHQRSVHLTNAGRMIFFAPMRLASIDNVFDDDVSNVNTSGNGLDSKARRYGFKPPAHSESFLTHLESVKSSWPRITDSIDDESDSEDNSRSHNDGGVRCAGEPSIDPSRMLHSVVDGESDWI